MDGDLKVDKVEVDHVDDVVDLVLFDMMVVVDNMLVVRDDKKHMMRVRVDKNMMVQDGMMEDEMMEDDMMDSEM